MKHLTVFFVLLPFLLGMNVAVGADFQKGADAYNKGDYATALKEWRPLAEQGQAGAENNPGWMYDKGQGVPQDDKEAVKWYRLAAEQGDAYAQSNLGVTYEKGQGVPQDHKEAANTLFEKLCSLHIEALPNALLRRAC